MRSILFIYSPLTLLVSNVDAGVKYRQKIIAI